MKVIAFLLLCSLHVLAQPTIKEDGTQVLLDGKVLLDATKDGFMRVLEIHSAPNGQNFLVLVCGFECFDNKGFLFRANGTGKRMFPGRGSYILQNKVEWSADSKYVFYFRINSTAADLPLDPPREEWKQINVRTGANTVATKRRLKPQATYAVIHLWSDVLNMRAAPHARAAIIGTIPSDGNGIRYTGETKRTGTVIWAKVKFRTLTGWVNQSYLSEELP